VKNLRLSGNECKRHTLREMGYVQNVLIANSDSGLTDLFRGIFRRHAAHTTFTVAATLDQTLQHSCRTPFDAAIIVLDNITVPTNSDKTQVEEALRAIGQIQVRGAMPVTALAFRCYGSDFIDRVRDAGTDSFLLLPAEPYAIEAAYTAAFDEFVRRESSGMAPLVRLTESFLAVGYEDIDLRLAEDRLSIDFCAHRQPEEFGRYLKQYDRAYARMLRAIRAAGFTRVSFEELGLEVDGDRLQGSFHVRPLDEVFREHDEDDTDEGWQNDPIDC